MQNRCLNCGFYDSRDCGTGVGRLNHFLRLVRRLFAARRRLVLSHAGTVAGRADQRVGRRCLGRAFS